MYLINEPTEKMPIIPDSSMLKLLNSLPQLSELIVPSCRAICFGREPRQFLKQQQRTLRIKIVDLENTVQFYEWVVDLP